MSTLSDALAQNPSEAPHPRVAALLDELARAKAELAAAERQRKAERQSIAERQSLPSAHAIRTQRLHLPTRSPLLPFDDANWHAAEQYRIARTRITQHPQKPSVLVVSSAGTGDGKTVTAVNIAASLALSAEGNVVLVEADFRRGTLHYQLGISSSAGLGEVLEGRASLSEALIRTEQLPRLCVLQAGNPASNAGELLDSPEWTGLADSLRHSFQYVVMDAPPVAGVADYELIQAVCDGTLLVLRPDHSRRAAAFHALGAIPKDKLIGVIMNSVPHWFLDHPGLPEF